MKTKILFLSFLIAFSCSQNDSSITKEESSKFEKVGIKSINTITSSNSIFNTFTQTDYYKTLSESFGEIDFTKIELMSLTTSNVNFLKIYFKNSSYTMLAIYDNVKLEFVNAYVHEYKISNSKELVNQYTTSGQKFLSLIVDSKTKAIESISTISNPQAKTQSWSSWSKCMKTAYESCSADWQCAILCGLVFTECIAATAIACLFY